MQWLIGWNWFGDQGKMGGCVTKESALWPCGINKSFWYEILMKMLFDVCVF